MQDPHGTVKATLLEVQFPVGVRTLPTREHLTSTLLVQGTHGAPLVPSTSGTNGNEPFQGNKKTTYPVLDTYQTTGTRGSPTGSARTPWRRSAHSTLRAGKLHIQGCGFNLSLAV